MPRRRAPEDTANPQGYPPRRKRRRRAKPDKRNYTLDPLTAEEQCTHTTQPQRRDRCSQCLGVPVTARPPAKSLLADD